LKQRDKLTRPSDVIWSALPLATNSQFSSSHSCGWILKLKEREKMLLEQKLKQMNVQQPQKQ